jgi:hypothetical protein
MFAHLTSVWWQGFSISISIPISISMRYFLRWVDEIRTHRDRDRYRDRDRILIASVPVGLMARFHFCILSA